MRTLLISAFVIFALNLAHAQQWSTYFEDQNLKIEIAEWQYDNPKYGKHHKRLIFRYINLTQDTLSISCSKRIAYDNVELADSPERIISLTLDPGQVQAYSDEQRDKRFYIFVSDADGMIKRKLTDFELTNITY